MERSEDAAYWAHTPNDRCDTHALRAHLIATGDRAESFGEKIGYPDLTRLLGLWHDIGKATKNFQHYLRALHEGRSATSSPHAIWGAALAYGFRDRGGPWRELTLPIAGHHGGLKAPSLVKNDVREAAEREPEVLDKLGEVAASLPAPSSVSSLAEEPLDRELRIRFLLSALVDADRLDTEAHFRPDAAETRGLRETSLRDLWKRFREDQERLIKAAEDTEVNRIRNEVYEACLEAAEGPHGIYRLTVPTGGGKTRSGLGFALRHTLEHDLDRVIVAIPYTSIIEQTADVYRDILGEQVVLEHHSRAAFGDGEGQDETSLQLRLATDNWEVPVVVTTTVQLFESLFSYHPSAVRKIHRTANSVLLLDEVQTLPVDLLEPTTDALRWLVEEAGTTVVLSTATQPALHDTPYVQSFREQEVREIVPGYPDHFAALRRVRYERVPGSPGWREIADRLADERQVLTVLNTRADALSALQALPTTEDAFHLSTLLCPAHRRDQLDEIQRRLRQDEPVRVVSTQVVEAGVDIDFPVVYRALGPLDRIVQAAGRCNREGQLEEGRVWLFDPAEGSVPPGAYRTGLGHARQMLREADLTDLHDPDIYEAYFERLFRDQDLDERDIQSLRRDLRYRKTSERYRLIDQDTDPVVVDYRGEGLDRARRWIDAPSRRRWTQLQPYTVSLYRDDIEEQLAAGRVSELADGLYRWDGTYDALYGVREVVDDPADLS